MQIQGERLGQYSHRAPERKEKERKSDLCDFNRGTVDGTRWAGVSVSETADPPGTPHATVSRVYTEGCDKAKQQRKKKHSVSDRSVGGNAWAEERVQRETSRLVQAAKKGTATQKNHCLQPW